MNRSVRAFLLLLLVLAAVVAATVAPARAQDAEFLLRVQRTFGYGNGSDVRGSFRMSIYGDEKTIQSVRFLMDGKEIASAEKAPFTYSFQTSQYPDGWHDFVAEIQTTDGRTVTTPVVRLHFLSASEQGVDMQRVVIPLVSAILGLMVLGILIQVLMLRRNPGDRTPGAARSYGLKGGAICPRCGRAYPIHFWSLNLPGGYIDRCDYCGKWAFVRSRSRAELDAAVEAERTAASLSEHTLPAAGEGAESEEERLKKLLDDSKYTE